jgi:hypothetical protein
MVRARMLLQLARAGKAKGACRLGLTMRRLFLPATSSFCEEMLRLEAGSALLNGRARCALGYLNTALYRAEQRSNEFGLGLLLVARAKVREHLGLPGAELDRERGLDQLEALGARDCYLLRTEGWLDPVPKGCELPRC